MKIHSTLALLLTATLATSCNAQEKPTQAPALQEQQQPAATLTPEQIKNNISYFLGYQSGSQMSTIPALTADDINLEVFAKAVKDGLSMAEPTVSEDDLAASLPLFQKTLQDRAEAKAKENAEASSKWIAEMAKVDGVNKTESGLLYKVVTPGGDKKYEEKEYTNPLFTVNYKGMLPDDTVFDQSPEGGAEFPLQLIPGFTEALKMMPIGAKWEIYIPAELAYGPQSPSPLIGPNQALHFELELTGIKEGPKDDQSEMSLSPEQLKALLEQQAGADESAQD